jgi:hypothetical protein
MGPFRIVLKVRRDMRSSRCTTGAVDTGQISNQKNLNYFVWTSLGSRVNIWINFSYRFTLRCQQSDLSALSATGSIYTGSKFTAGVVL